LPLVRVFGFSSDRSLKPLGLSCRLGRPRRSGFLLAFLVDFLGIPKRLG
jgi:hypothetical protein